MLLNRSQKVFKKVLYATRMANIKKSIEEQYTNSEYDTSSTGSNESESAVSVQLSSSKASSETASLKTLNDVKLKTVSKSTRKKFFRSFSNVEESEDVLNRYSCALVGDILLQGNLYITTNYFAFYSNVFGYVTRILIPILSVEKITKEKTAKIIPNAIGIATSESRYVFGSLMSRDNTLKYLTTIWQKVKSEAPLITNNELIGEDDDAFNDEEQNESEIDSPEPKNIQPTGDEIENKKAPKAILKIESSLKRLPRLMKSKKLSRPSVVLVATTILLVILYLTATILLYRINQIENRYSRALHDLSFQDSSIIYPDLLKWQAELHYKTNDAVYGYIDSNLIEISKIKQSLERLSSVLGGKDDPLDETSFSENITS